MRIVTSVGGASEPEVRRDRARGRLRHRVVSALTVALLAYLLPGCADLPEPGATGSALVLRSDLEEDCGACDDTRSACVSDCAIQLPAGSAQRLQCEEQCEAVRGACRDATACEEADACVVVTSELDLDVPRIQLRGSFRVNNTVPVGYDSQTARIELRSERLGVVELGAVHTGSYNTWVIPGTYDVVYLHDQGELLPANAETIIYANVDLTASMVFDIPIQSVLVMGTITVNGAPPTTSYYEIGQIRFRDRETGATFPVGTTHNGEYFAMVIPGVYDVVYRRLGGSYHVPRNTEAILLEEVTVAGVTVIDVDVPMAVRTGEIHINGSLAPSGLYENGQLSLRDTRTGDVFPLAHTRDQSYAIRVVPGTYDVLYSHIMGSYAVPRNELAVVAANVAMIGDGDLVIDIPVVTLEGRFSLDGESFPAGVYNRARFWLQGAEDADVFPIGTTATSSYSVVVIPGTYDVVYQAMLTTGLVPENPWSVVSRGHTVGSPSRLGGSGSTLHLAVTSGWIGADVTVWGAAPHTGVYQNGAILAFDGTGEMVPLGHTIDAGGAALVLGGDYAIHYSHVLGQQVPSNGDARVGGGATAPVLAALAVDLQPGTLEGSFSQGGVAFPPLASQRGVLSLRDVVTGDEIALGNSDSGSYTRTLLGGRYEVVYDHVTGGSVVANRRANLGCVTFAPEAPSPPRPGGLTGLTAN